jgi:hypothetical protein
MYRTYRLQGLLDLSIQSAGLEGNDLGSSIRVMSNGGTTLRAEDAVNSMAGRALASPALDGAGDIQLFLGDNSNERYDKVNNGVSPGDFNATNSRSSHSGVGSHRSGHRQ